MDPQAPPITAAIVDLDGTLVDTLPDFEVALNDMLRELRQPAIKAQAIATMIGRGSEHLVRSVLAQVGAPASLYEAAWAGYWSHYLSINGRHAHLYPGVREGLTALRQAGLRLACVTNKPTDFAQPLLDRKELAGFFDVVFGGDAFERKKPDPLPLRRACEALVTAPAQALVIGDSSNDALAARAAGCPVVLVTYGYNHGEPARSVDADGFVESIAQVPGWISRRCVLAARP